MSTAQEHRTATIELRDWLQAIVNDPNMTPVAIVSHIMKHCGEELEEDFTKWAHGNSEVLSDWIASMENLLFIFKHITKTNDPGPMRRLKRLERHHRNNPHSSTPKPQ
jgi:hypothetical protein